MGFRVIDPLLLPLDCLIEVWNDNTVWLLFPNRPGAPKIPIVTWAEETLAKMRGEVLDVDG